MFEAHIKITEKEMTWSELKALCESKKLRVLSLALIDDNGKVSHRLKTLPLRQMLDMRCNSSLLRLILLQVQRDWSRSR